MVAMGTHLPDRYDGSLNTRCCCNLVGASDHLIPRRKPLRNGGCLSIWRLVWTLLLFAGLGVIVLVPKLLIDLALERKGKWLTVVEFVNGLCIAIALLAGVYALLIGAVQLWDESWQAFLLSAGVLAFVIYFYIAKTEAERKTELTPKAAEEIVRQ